MVACSPQSGHGVESADDAYRDSFFLSGPSLRPLIDGRTDANLSAERLRVHADVDQAAQPRELQLYLSAAELTS